MARLEVPAKVSNQRSSPRSYTNGQAGMDLRAVPEQHGRRLARVELLHHLAYVVLP